MKSSESIKNIGPALFKAQALMESAKKESTNPFFNSKYANLTSVIAAVKPQLHAEGILVLQPIDGEAIETVLVHVASGEWVSSQFVLPPGLDAQKKGAAISYGRRFTLQSLVFLDAEDDDGESLRKAPEISKDEMEALILKVTDPKVQGVARQFMKDHPTEFGALKKRLENKLKEQTNGTR